MNLIQILTNENKLIINILQILALFIESILFYKTITLITEIQKSRKSKIYFILIVCLSNIIINFLSNELIKDILSISSFILCTYFLLKINIKKSILSLIFSYVGAIISGSLSQEVMSLLTHMRVDKLMNIPIYYTFVWIISSILWYAMIILISFIKNNKKMRLYNIQLKYFIFINLILGIITVALESYLLSVYSDSIPVELTVTIIITLLIYFSISMYSVIRTNQLEKTQQELENEISYNKTLSLMHDNIRCFKHDFNNIVQSIGGYVALNDMNGLNEYYKKLLEECKLNNNLNLLNPETINNPPIYSLLTNKYYLAIQKNINMTFSIFTDLSKINLNTYELTRILGILLDNAIEAAEESTEKLIEIEFISDTKKQLFIIKNSCKDSNISTTKIFEKGYSTKSGNSGIGLWKVHKILSKNTNLDLFTTVKDNIFSQQLEVFY